MSEDQNNQPSTYQHGKIKDVDLQKEMETSYLDYAMSVIVGRALPDVRDGMKPNFKFQISSFTITLRARRR